MQELPRIVLLVGLPASGKSTWLQRQGLPALSSDHVRYLLIDDEDNQTIHRLVFATLRYLMRQRLAAGAKLTYIDATNLTAYERRPWIRFAQMHECVIDAIFFDTPTEVCLKRNAKRPRVVPADVIRKMAHRLRAPSVDEGFAKVTSIRP